MIKKLSKEEFNKRKKELEYTQLCLYKEDEKSNKNTFKFLFLFFLFILPIIFFLYNNFSNQKSYLYLYFYLGYFFLISVFIFLISSFSSSKFTIFKSTLLLNIAFYKKIEISLEEIEKITFREKCDGKGCGYYLKFDFKDSNNKCLGNSYELNLTNKNEFYILSYFFENNFPSIKLSFPDSHLNSRKSKIQKLKLKYFKNGVWRV